MWKKNIDRYFSPITSQKQFRSDHKACSTFALGKNLGLENKQGGKKNYYFGCCVVGGSEQQ